jgi:hypothetical protein
LKDIDTTRKIFNAGSSSFMGYLFPWLVQATLPLVLVFFLIRKKYWPGIVTFLIMLYLYTISGEKIVYVTCFMVLFFFAVGKSYVGKVKYFVAALILGLLVLPIGDYFLNERPILQGTFVMRMLFLPAELNYLYFDFFNGHPLYFSASSFFNLFFTYPFKEPVGFVISEAYFHTSAMNSNNGIISDGYMNLGYWGVGINIVLVSGIFFFFNALDLDARYLGIFFSLVFVFLSAPMLSIFMTSGLWIIFLMALTIMKRRPLAGQVDGGPSIRGT